MWVVIPCAVACKASATAAIKALQLAPLDPSLLSFTCLLELELTLSSHLLDLNLSSFFSGFSFEAELLQTLLSFESLELAFLFPFGLLCLTFFAQLLEFSFALESKFIFTLFASLHNSLVVVTKKLAELLE